MKSAIFVLFVAALLAPIGSARGDLIAYWNFNGLSVNPASPPGSGGAPTTISASQGSGTFDLTGWGGNVDDAIGTSINAISPDPAGTTLSLSAGSGTATPGNETFVAAQFSTSGQQDIVVTFATRSSTDGFSSGLWSYSVDGANFTNHPGNTAFVGSFALKTLDLSSVSAIENRPTVHLRYTLTGAAVAAGFARIDNLQINGVAVPEPASLVLVGLAATVLGMFRRRRQ